METNERTIDVDALIGNNNANRTTTSNNDVDATRSVVTRKRGRGSSMDLNLRSRDNVDDVAIAIGGWSNWNDDATILALRSSFALYVAKIHKYAKRDAIDQRNVVAFVVNELATLIDRDASFVVNALRVAMDATNDDASTNDDAYDDANDVHAIETTRRFNDAIVANDDANDASSLDAIVASLYAMDDDAFVAWIDANDVAFASFDDATQSRMVDRYASIVDVDDDA
jgi:hypothetical protein